LDLLYDFTYRFSGEVYDNLTDIQLAELDDGTTSTFIYAWPYKSEFRIKLTVVEADGDRCSVEKVYYDEDCFEPCAPTGGGGAPPYRQDQGEDEPCTVIIKKVYLSDLDDSKEPTQVITIGEVKFE
jgi:hypothetical protein